MAAPLDHNAAITTLSRFERVITYGEDDARGTEWRRDQALADRLARITTKLAWWR